MMSLASAKNNSMNTLSERAGGGGGGGAGDQQLELTLHRLLTQATHICEDEGDIDGNNNKMNTSNVHGHSHEDMVLENDVIQGLDLPSLLEEEEQDVFITNSMKNAFADHQLHDPSIVNNDDNNNNNNNNTHNSLMYHSLTPPSSSNSPFGSDSDDLNKLNNNNKNNNVGQISSSELMKTNTTKNNNRIYKKSTKTQNAKNNKINYNNYTDIQINNNNSNNSNNNNNNTISSSGNHDDDENDNILFHDENNRNLQNTQVGDAFFFIQEKNTMVEDLKKITMEKLEIQNNYDFLKDEYIKNCISLKKTLLKFKDSELNRIKVAYENKLLKQKILHLEHKQKTIKTTSRSSTPTPASISISTSNSISRATTPKATTPKAIVIAQDKEKSLSPSEQDLSLNKNIDSQLETHDEIVNIDSNSSTGTDDHNINENVNSDTADTAELADKSTDVPTQQ